jgi:hypothetical protein
MVSEVDPLKPLEHDAGDVNEGVRHTPAMLRGSPAGAGLPGTEKEGFEPSRQTFIHLTP